MSNWVKKTKNDLFLKSLRSRRKKYKNEKKLHELSDVYLEIGDYCRTLLTDKQLYDKSFVSKIIGKYEKAISTAIRVDYHENCSMAYRALAEMALENEDHHKAIKNIEKSMLYALKANNASFIQLCFHQCAYIYSSVSTLLEKAAEVGERGLQYLNDKADQIDSDSEAVKIGGDSQRRKAGLENLLAGIYLDLNKIEKATIHIEQCLDYSSENDDYELHYRALLFKLRITNGLRRLDIAKNIVETAQKITDKNLHLKNEAKYYLAIEKLRFNQILDAKFDFWQLYSKNLDDFIEEDSEAIKNYLVFIFKLEKRLDRIEKRLLNEEDIEIKAQIFEKIADDASDLQLTEFAHLYYEKMLKSSANIEQKRLALVSLAETSRELNDFVLSAYYFKELYAVEEKLNYSPAKLLETEISIAIVSSNIATIPLLERLQFFEITEQKCQTNQDKVILLTEFVQFLRKHHDLYTEEDVKLKDLQLENLKKQLENLNENFEKDACNSQDSLVSINNDENLMASSYIDEFEYLNDYEILIKIKVKL